MLFNTLLVIVLSVSGVLSQSGWGVTYTPERICALKGSSVDMSCTYKYPKSYWVQKTVWFIHDWNSKQEGEPEDLFQNREYSGRVEYLGKKHGDCTFRIKQLRESDSAVYRFRFLTYSQDGKYTGLPGVSLTVTGLQVKVTENEAQSVTLTCSRTCTLSGRQTFTWYKNGKVVPYEYKYSLNLQFLQNTARKYQQDDYLQFIASSGDAGSYSCAVRGHENLPSPTVTLYAPKNTSVSVSPSGEIVEGSSVTLTCSSDANPPVQRYIWYKTGSAFLWRRSDWSYTINKIKSWDAREYYCEAENAFGTDRSPPINLKVLCVKVEMKSDTVREGELVTLTCKITCTDLTGSQTFIWYNNGQSLQNTNQKYENHNYFQIKASSGDAGSYSCAVRGHENLLSPAVTLYPPKSILLSVRPSGEIVEGSSVTLTCSSSDANPPVLRYTWYVNNRAVSSETGGPEDSYTIKSVTLQDAGEYYCQAENVIGTNRSPPKRLDVKYPPKSVSVSVIPSGEIVEGRSVTLTCSSDANPPVQNYTWFKKNETGVWQAGSGLSLNFSNFRSWNRGQYYCEARNKHGGQNSTAVSINIEGGQSLIVAAAVGVAAILALVFLGVVCLRRRKSTNETEGDRQGKKSPIYGNVSGMAMSHTGTQDTDTDDGEVPLYASVQPANTRNQEQVLYSTVQKPLPQGEEGVQYASIQFPPSSAATRSPAPSIKEDCVLYSTLQKLDM